MSHPVPHPNPDPALAPRTDPSPNGQSPHPSSNGKPAARRRRRWAAPLAAALVVGGGALAAVALSPKLFPNKRPDLLWHKIKLELLPIAVVEKGTLESAENRDVVCRVKAGSKGTYASTIKWVIDDGSVVRKGDLLMQLDDSALLDQRSNQSIAVEKARAEFITADENYRITVKTNEANIADTQSKVAVAELGLDKFIGFRVEPALNPLGAVAGVPATLSERGDYQRQLDEVSASLKAAESDLDAYRERSAWADRSSKLGYLTPTQAKAEQTKMSGATDKVSQLRQQKYILETFTRQESLTTLRSTLDVARINLGKAMLEAKSKEVQAESDRKTKLSILQQELEKLREIDEQIAECRVYAPQDGMVVYFKETSGRFSSSGSQQGLIAQGEQVKEGQKLMRIPDLRRMQVNTKVHEAQVARIKGDDRRSTGMSDLVRTGMLTNTDPLTRLFGQAEWAQDTVRQLTRDKEYYVASRGMQATVRVDAYPDRLFSGRVKSVAAVAAQQDWGSSDVKVYQTLVLIEETVEGLKPDMNAEVTIHVDDSTEPVLAVPIQAVLGGAEAGPKRTVYVHTPDGPQEREVVLGKFNDKMIEIREGLKEGDEVLLNPKVLVGTAVKTREEGGDPRAKTGGPGNGVGGEGGEKKKGKGGGKGGPGMKGGPGGGPGGMPGGGPPKGGPQI